MGICRWLPLLSLLGCSLLVTHPKIRSDQDRWQDLQLTGLPLEKPVTIYWDRHKVPFIEAQTDQDLAFTLGYIHGYLRHYQLQMVKMISSGRLSELAGPTTIDIDKTLRILNFGKAVPEIIEQMPAETKKWSENFLKGLNHAFQLDIPRPADALALRIPNEPWTLTDLVRFWRLAAVDINWMVYAKFLGLKNEPHWEKLYQDLVEVNGDPSLISLSKPQQKMFATLEYFNKSGSNSYAIGKNKSFNQHAILANDPHLGISLPPAWLLLGCKSPSFNAAGFMIPGIPFFAIGRNPHISWGGTNMRGISSFLYELTEEQVKAATVKKELIKVRWWIDSEVEIRETQFGPIFTDSPLIKSTKPIALYWVGHQPSDEITAFLKANRARNWQEFQQAFSTYAVSAQNLTYADDQGNIGHLLAYKKPIRKDDKLTGLINSTANPVIGFRKPTDLGSKFNPPQGFLASANDAGENREKVGLFFSTHDRIDRLNKVLAEKDNLSRQDIIDLQNDVYSSGAVRLQQLILSEVRRRQPVIPVEHQRTWELITAWDGNYSANSPGALAFETFAIRFAAFYFNDRYQNDTLADAAIKESHWKTLLILHQRSPGWDKNFATRFAQALTTAQEMIEEFKTYGQFRWTPVAHLLGNAPYIGDRFVFARQPTRGNGDTLYKRAANQELGKAKVFYGQNARHISFMNNPNENYFSLFGGNDGYLNNEHMTDMVNPMENNEFVKIPLEISEVRKIFTQNVTVLAND